jgi:uncharacterized protein (TIGR02466 family)
MANVIDLFSLKVMAEKINTDWNKDGVIQFIEKYLKDQNVTKEVDRNLHKNDLFLPIVNFMNQKVSEYWNLLEYSKDYPIEITGMWANRYDRKHERPHDLDVDGPAIITAVFYVHKESAEMGNLYFGNPIELLWQTQPLSEFRRHENRYTEFDGRTGDLILFPSWLQHGIRPNKTDISRYSIAANYELKGLKMIKQFVGKK